MFTVGEKHNGKYPIYNGKGDIIAECMCPEDVKEIVSVLNQHIPERKSIMKAFFSLEDWLYGNGKDKPIEVKSAMVWGGLWVAHKHGELTWEEMIHQYGEFMSKQMNLR